jgi:hypothetical protein
MAEAYAVLVFFLSACVLAGMCFTLGAMVVCKAFKIPLVGVTIINRKEP